VIGKKQSQETIEKRIPKISGKNSSQYKHGLYCKARKSICVDCGISISPKAKRCHECNYKVVGEKISKKAMGKNNSQYKDGHTMKKYYCIDCKKEVCYGNLRCRNCYIKNKLKNKKVHYCIEPNCNTLVSIRDVRCSSCATKFFWKNNPIKTHEMDCNCAPCKSKRGEFSNKNNPFYGKKHTEKTRKLQSLHMGGTGVPYENTEYGAEFDNALKEQVRFRDKYKCKICGCSQLENSQQLDIHHIDYDKKNNTLKNLISLCRGCHAKTRVERKQWTEYFIKILLKEYHYVS
jgi:hypothetical protein